MIQQQVNLAEHYDNLYKDSLKKIKADNYQIDHLIDSGSDKRFGITLIARPDDKTKRAIQRFLQELREIEPQQYHYPNSDLHITVMSIISCYDGFDLSQISIKDYIDTIYESINGLPGFEIEFRGLTASPSCIMVQGFMANATLNLIRDNLRSNFKGSDLQQSIDKRYSIQTAHSTITRLRKGLKNKSAYLSLIEKYRGYNFGTFLVDNLELVFNDWYQRKENTKVLHRFNL